MNCPFHWRKKTLGAETTAPKNASAWGTNYLSNQLKY